MVNGPAGAQTQTMATGAALALQEAGPAKVTSMENGPALAQTQTTVTGAALDLQMAGIAKAKAGLAGVKMKTMNAKASKSRNPSHGSELARIYTDSFIIIKPIL